MAPCTRVLLACACVWPIATTGAVNRILSSEAADRNGRRQRRSRPSTHSCPTCRNPSLCVNWWLWGKQRWIIENVIIRNSNRNLVWAIFEGRGWRGFHHHATLFLPSQPTASWCGSGAFSPFSARFTPPMRAGEPPSSLTPCAKQLRAPRLCRCEPNGIIPARSPPFAARLQPTWPAPCPDPLLPARFLITQ